MFACKVMARTGYFGPIFPQILDAWGSGGGLQLKVLKKIIQMPKYIMILHQCTKNYDHMMYGCGVTVWNRWTEGRDGQ